MRFVRRIPNALPEECAVFAESDMIHKQQTGIAMRIYIAGLCQALVRNYFEQSCKRKGNYGPRCIPGGVAANVGIASRHLNRSSARI
jgi:activator of 2-hydroxyglutaryl-CoA dehydratase